MKRWVWIGLLSCCIAGASPMACDYSVLLFGNDVVSSSGEIDFGEWLDSRFPAARDFVAGEDGKKRRYVLVGDLVFEYRRSTQLDELNQRSVTVAEATMKEFSIIHRRVHYQGRRLTYAEGVYAGGGRWWLGTARWFGGPYAIRFGRYLIFEVQARPYFRREPMDLVVYDLLDDTYAVHRSVGRWQAIHLYCREDAVPDPRVTPGDY